jgi:ABC-2 type transport system ATP-binding protein
MTVGEAMHFFCAYRGVPPRHDLLDRLGLAQKKGAQYQELSGGQQRRLSLALAVIHDPPVLFLDEPTSGLDVASRAELHRLMHDLRDAGATIILATHDMAEAEQMTDRVAILLRGRIAAMGSPLELTATGAALTKVTVHTETSSLSDPALSLPAVSQSTFRDEYAVFFSTDVGPTVSAIIAHIESRGDSLIDLRVERPSLEDRFLEITSEGGTP